MNFYGLPCYINYDDFLRASKGQIKKKPRTFCAEMQNINILVIN